MRLVGYVESVKYMWKFCGSILLVLLDIFNMPFRDVLLNSIVILLEGKACFQGIVYEYCS